MLLSWTRNSFNQINCNFNSPSTHKYLKSKSSKYLFTGDISSDVIPKASIHRLSYRPVAYAEPNREHEDDGQQDDKWQEDKEKVKLSLCLINSALFNEDTWRERRLSSTILDLCSIRRRVVSFRPRPLYHRGKSPRTHWVGGWVRPRVDLDAVEYRKIFSPCQESNPRPSSQ
jgi:hypothetical protein